MEEEPVIMKEETSVVKEDVLDTAVAEYRKITPEEALEMMAQDGVRIIDVREQEEYDSGHIEGAELIPHGQILEGDTTGIPDKEAVLLIYCRSGNRSGKAANKLVELGYTNVYDFGGIIDWPYDIVE